MGDEKQVFDYNLILADLEAKRAALDAAIASLRIAAASGVLLTNGSLSSNAAPASYGAHIVSGTSGYNTEVPSGAFLGKSVREAAMLYLSLVKKKQTTREIAAALQAGGMESTSKNFTEMVGTVLYQIKKTGGGVLRIGDAWGLAEWYPAGFRASAQEPKGKKRKTRKINKKAPGPCAQIETFLLEATGTRFHSKEIASKLKIDPKAVVLFLGQLIKKNKVERTADGLYQALSGHDR